MAVEDELGDVGARVVAGGVEVLTLGADFLVVDGGELEGFAVGDRFDEPTAVWPTQTGATIGEKRGVGGEGGCDLVEVRGVGGEVGGAH